MRYLRSTLWLAGLLACTCTAMAADTAVELELVSPAEARFDAEKLGQFDSLLSRQVESGRLAGAVVLLARDDKVGYLETWGERDLDSDAPMTLDTIFRIYSMSKPITSVATMQLVERGEMSLDDPVSKYLPELGDLKVLVAGENAPSEVSATNQITVRDLLRHTSGFTYGFFGSTDVDKRYLEAGILRQDATIEETVKKLGTLPLLYQPATRWHYSVSTDVLGRLVEVVSGERFDEYLAAHVFAPLEMDDTSFVVPGEKQSRLAVLYVPEGDEALQPAPAWRDRNFTSAQSRFFSGGGGLCSTTGDYYRFCRALLSGGALDGKRILQQETVDQMTRNQLGEGIERDEGFEFGLGFAIRDEGEFSWGGAAGTRFFINPKRNLIGIYMVQIIPPGNRDLTADIRRIAYEAAP